MKIAIEVDGKRHELPQEHSDAIQAVVMEDLKFDGTRLKGAIEKLFPADAIPSVGSVDYKSFLLRLAGLALKGLMNNPAAAANPDHSQIKTGV